MTTSSDSVGSSRTFCPPAVRIYVLVSAILASSMGFIDGTVVSLAMPAIRADLAATLAEAQWISNSYMLFLSALVLLGGAAGDVYGIRSIFAGGIALFIVTSLGCALAPDATSLILVRAAQGVGAALMVPSSLAIIAKAYPANERGWAIGQWAAYSSLTTALGPFIGGMVLSFGEDWMWRLIFAINVPIGLIALAMLYLKVPADRAVSHRRLDLIGAALATIGLGALAWGFTEFGVKAADRSMSPLVAIGVGVLLLAAFVYWESRARNPMVKLRLFGSWAFSGANLYTLLLYFAFSAAIFFLPMTIISAWRAQEWEASLLFLPVSVSIVLLSGHAGKFADRFGPRLPLAVGALLVGIACLGMMMTVPLMNLWTATFPFLVLAGIGMGLLVSPLSTAVMLATPDEDTGLGSGVNNAVARIAGLIAVAVLGAVAGLVFAAILDRPDSGLEFGAMAGQLDQAVDAARVAATNKAFQVIAGIAGVACIAAAALAWVTQPAWNKADKETV